MGYTIKTTSGNVLISNLRDGTTNTDTGLVLIGRNYTGYGEFQNDNFIRLLENFAADIPPDQSVGFRAIPGTLWWDSGRQILKIYTGQDYVPVSQRTVSNAAPMSYHIGDQWWDTANNQLKVWSGADWLIIGPVAASGQGKTGVFVETVSASAQPLVNTYISGNVVSVYNATDPFLVANSSFAAFDTINTGFNVGTQLTVSGNLDVTSVSSLNDDVTIGGQLYLNWTNGPGPALLPTQTNMYDLGSTGQAFRDVYAQGTLSISGANVYVDNSALVLQNNNATGNVDIYVKGTSQSIQALHVDGISGRVSVSKAPVFDNDVATRYYVDTEVQSVVQEIFNTSAQVQGNLEQVLNDYRANISYVVGSTNSNLATVQSSLNSNISALNQSVNNSLSNLNSVTANLQNQTNIINTALSSLASINSPHFTGNPTAPTAAQKDNSPTISTTAYVDRESAALQNSFNSQIQSLSAALNGSLAAGTAGLAPINSPRFTGVPTAPTPATGDNSTNIATTAFVNGAISGHTSLWQGSAYTVSASPPSGGNPGDFWFQIG
jgi:hypothetical protein